MDEFKKVLAAITNAAPAVGSFFGAPGIAVGAAIKAIGSAFGLSESATPDQVAAAVAADPNAALKLNQARLDYQLASEQENTKRLGMQLADVQNARAREVETTKSTGKRDFNLYCLSWLLVTGFFTLLGILIFYRVPVDSSGVIFLLFGSLASGFGAVVQYFFGSSQSSSTKSETIADIAAKK